MERVNTERTHNMVRESWFVLACRGGLGGEKEVERRMPSCRSCSLLLLARRHDDDDDHVEADR